MATDNESYMVEMKLAEAAEARGLIGYIIGTGSTAQAEVERMGACVATIDSALALPSVASSGLPTQDMADAASVARHWLALRQAGN